MLSPVAHLSFKLDPMGGDVLRTSLTNNFKVPDPVALMGRLTPNRLYPDLARENNPLLPDTLGNPTLRPELATGIYFAWEHYFCGAGIIAFSPRRDQCLSCRREWNFYMAFEREMTATAKNLLRYRLPLVVFLKFLCDFRHTAQIFFTASISQAFRT